jgi:hypothetical protein
VAELNARGVLVDPAGQAGAHMVAFAAMRGLTCRGPERENDDPTYVLLDDWVGTQPDREPEAALAELARRYLAGHGPATDGDLARWAGIGSKLASQGFRLIASQLAEVDVAGETAWMLASKTPPGDPAPRVRLLGAFDAYLLGYRDRGLALPPRFARRIQAGGGWIHPAVVLDGLVIGTWRAERRGQRLAVHVEPFEELPDTLRTALETEAADVGRFLHRDAVLEIEST